MDNISKQLAEDIIALVNRLANIEEYTILLQTKITLENHIKNLERTSLQQYIVSQMGPLEFNGGNSVNDKFLQDIGGISLMQLRETYLLSEKELKRQILKQYQKTKKRQRWNYQRKQRACF